MRGLALRRYAAPVTCTLEDGRPLIVRPNDYIQCSRIVVEWEGGLYRSLRPLVPAGGVVLDVGAQVGISAVEFGPWVGAGGRVVCFEPVPQHRDQLRDNLALNDLLDRTTIVAAAISDVAGEASFYFATTDNSGLGSLHARAAQPHHLVVQTMPLDAWRIDAGIGQVDLVKLDIEGAELLALRGMRAGLATRAYRAIFIEVHPPELAAFGHQAAEVTRTLAEAGYDLWWWRDDGWTPFEHRFLEHGYLLARPRDTSSFC